MNKAISEFKFENNDNYLVQRAKVKKVNLDDVDCFFDGIDSYIKFEYMGKAEFEFGELSLALDFMNNPDNSCHYDITTHTFENGNKLYFYAPKHFSIADMVSFVETCKQHRFSTLCRTDMENAFNGFNPKETNTWFVLNNGLRGLPFVISTSLNAVFAVYREAYLNQKSNKNRNHEANKQKEYFYHELSVGDKVIVPDDENGYIDYETIVGFTDNTITIRKNDKKFHFTPNQCIFLEKQ